jgi:hypothetical protein
MENGSGSDKQEQSSAEAGSVNDLCSWSKQISTSLIHFVHSKLDVSSTFSETLLIQLNEVVKPK